MSLEEGREGGEEREGGEGRGGEGRGGEGRGGEGDDCYTYSIDTTILK